MDTMSISYSPRQNEIKAAAYRLADRQTYTFTHRERGEGEKSREKRKVIQEGRE